MIQREERLDLAPGKTTTMRRLACVLAVVSHGALSCLPEPDCFQTATCPIFSPESGPDGPGSLDDAKAGDSLADGGSASMAGDSVADASSADGLPGYDARTDVGMGLSPATLSISPARFTFATVDIVSPPATPPSATFTVSNGGGSASAVSATLTPSAGTSISEISVASDTCTGTLASNTACQVVVTFKPATHGSKSATLVVGSNGPTATVMGIAQDHVSLAVTKTGTGSGTVTADSGAIDCGPTCSASYARTTSDPVVSLTATPAAGSAFAGWMGGGCTGTNPCSVTLAAATAVTAQFTLVQVPLTVTFHGLGTQTASIVSTPAGISCSGMTCTSAVSFDVNTTVSLVVTQAADAKLGWSNGCTGNPCVFRLEAPMTLNVTTTNQNVVFKSSRLDDGNLGGLSGANTFCNATAAAAGLPGNYVAWLGTSTTTAFATLGSARGWIRPDGLPFTDTVAGFQNSRVMWYPAVVDEFGMPVTTGMTFTGWLKAETCSDWTSSSGEASGGGVGEGGYFIGFNGFPCSSLAHVMCFGTDFTTPVSITPAAGRHVFATSIGFTPSGGLAAADALCQNEAQATALANPSRFLAALATSTASVASRFDLTGATWVRVDGVRVAASPMDFMAGNLLAPPATGANAQVIESPGWMGSSGGLTQPAMNAAENCDNWSSAASTSTAMIFDTAWGGPDAPNAFQEFVGHASSCDGLDLRLLCLEN